MPCRHFFRIIHACSSVLAAASLLFPVTALSEKDHLQPPTYHTPEERREAGQRHDLTEWLAVMALVELEWSKSQDHFFPSGAANEWGDSRSQTLQLGIEAKIGKQSSVELVTEYEAIEGQGTIDEAILDMDQEDWSISVGRQYLSFGEYFSHFITAPLLEFAETRANALEIEYQLNEFSQLSSYVYESTAKRDAGEHSSIQWGIGFETRNASESMKAGFGYISSLSPTIADLIEDSDDLVTHPAAAWNSYLAVIGSSYELTLEALQTLRRSTNQNRNIKPSAINLEIAWIPTPALQIGMRLEGGKDLPMQPSKRYGVSVTWLIETRFALKADYLYGEFSRHSENNDEPKYRQEAALQISFAF